MDKFIPVVIVLLSFLWAVPVLRMLNAWLIDKTMDGRLVLFTLAIHLSAIFTLWHYRQFLILLIYLGITSLLWLALPALDRLGDAIAMRRLRAHDIAHYQALLANDPRHTAAMSALADAYIEHNRLDEAIALYEQVIALDPEHTRAEKYRLEQARRLRERRRGRRPVAETAPPGPLVIDPPAAQEPASPPVPLAGPDPDEDGCSDDERRQEVWQWFNNLDNNAK